MFPVYELIHQTKVHKELQFREENQGWEEHRIKGRQQEESEKGEILVWYEGRK